MDEPEHLPDRWHRQDLPVLLQVARTLESDDSQVIPGRIAEHLGIDNDAVLRSLELLGQPGGYIMGKPMRGDNMLLAFHVTDLTERGRRAVGLWPNEDAAADALVDLLNQAADTTSDEDEAGALRKAGRLLRSVPSAVIADVTAALIRQQTGL